MYRPPPKPFNKVKTGYIIVTAGSIVAVLSGLFLYVVLTRVDLSTYFSSLGSPYDELGAYLDPAAMLPTIFMSIIGGGVSFIGSLVSKGNPRNGGIIAIVGSIVGGINVITLIGGIFLIKGSMEGAPVQVAMGSIPPLEDTRVKSMGLKRCPTCSALMPLDARFCPNCGQSPDGFDFK